MKKILLLAISFVFFNCNSVKEKNNDLIKMDLDGKVRSMFEFSYLKPSNRDSNNGVEYIFNNDGMITKRTEFNSDESEFFEGYQLYEYDTENNMTNSSVYSLDNQLLGTSELEYNTVKDLIGVKVLSLENKIYYRIEIQYSKASNETTIVTEKKYDSLNRLVDHNNKTINSNGRVVKSTFYDIGVKGQYYETEHDPNGKPVKIIACDSLGNIKWTQIKKYSDKGLLSSQSLISSDSITNRNWIVNYQFDDKNNWTKKYLIQDEDTTIYTERKIEYYE